MKKYMALMFLFPLYLTGMSQNQKANLAWGKKVDSVLSRMTLEEKIGQMAQVTLDVFDGNAREGVFELDPKKLREVIGQYHVGSVLNTAENRALSRTDWNTYVGEIQREARASRCGIPVLYGFDAIHGATYVQGATFFPQQIGQAATWNRALVRNAAAASAYESRAAGIPWNFSPVLDLGLNPTWPRHWETFGEDPYLVSEMGIQTVRGYQGGDPDERVLACLKHFLGYSDPRSGKDRTNAWIPESALREYHLPAFRAAVSEGARTVMVNSSLINGVPTHANKRILTDLLKGELGFTGLVVTDWQDIDNLYARDKVAASKKEAVMLAINAGIDMAMLPYDYADFCRHLRELVGEQKVAVSRIDDAVRRILRVKFEAGLFETQGAPTYPRFASKEFAQWSYEAAAESITLLKNEGSVLPLRPDVRVLVTGPNARSVRSLNGGWSYSWQGEKSAQFATQQQSVYSALQQRLGAAQVKWVPGVAYREHGKYFQDSVVDLRAVTEAASGVDVILLCLGENSYTEKPGDLNDLRLSEPQLQLARVAAATGKPVVLVLNEGRPRVISDVEREMAAILQLYLPGHFGAEALTDILLGQVNPSGKLPYTYPRYANALTPYIHKFSDEQVNPQGAYDYSADYNPQFPFGYGLSYTRFSYSGLALSRSTYRPQDTLEVSIRVKNEGAREGKEVVQLFVSDLVASVSPDVRRLRGFEKIRLKPGEEREVRFSVPVRELSFVDAESRLRLEEGEFRVRVGGQQAMFRLIGNEVR